MQLTDLEQEIDELYGVGTEMDVILSETEIGTGNPDLPDDDEDEDEEGDDDGDSEGDEEAREYQQRLLPEFCGLYMNDEGELVLEYENNAVQQMEDMLEGECDLEGPMFDMEDLDPEEAARPEYRTRADLGYSEGSGGARVGAGGGLLTIEYETPELLNRQKTYQRIVIEADVDGESVYDLTIRKLEGAGLGIDAEYDGDFGAVMVTSVNGKKEGEGGNFNEFYLNGEIGTDNAGDRKVSKGDVVEWRYAEETDGSCGGVPDFHKIRSMLAQYGGAAEYSPVAVPFGLISLTHYA